MKHHPYLKYIGLLIAILTGVPFSYGQREKNNIYLFDCTGSMKSNRLWEPAKTALDATISTQTSVTGSQFCVIPFGDTPYRYISFGSNQYADEKSVIDDALDKHISEAKYTRISGVLKAGFSKIDPNRENRIYLLTDGMPNGGDSPQKVADVISQWCANHRNCRLFYVALTNGVINPVIRKAIDDCRDAFVVQCEDKVIPQIADISACDLYTSLEELGNARELIFSMPGKYGIRAEAADSLFEVRIQNNSADGGRILLSLSPRQKLDIASLHQKLQGREYTFPVSLQCTDKRYFIANPVVMIHVSDEIPAGVTIAQGVDELKTEGAEWYGPFLWSDAAPDSKVMWDLTPVFRNELQNSVLDLTFRAAEGQNADFQAWYNGRSLSNGGTIKVEPGKPALIEVQFNHDASAGKRYFSLTPSRAEGLDNINGQPADDYEGTSLRTTYSVRWNPLKTFLFWLGIALLCALVIWFVILRRIFFPAITMGKIIITGPGTYYATKRIKGARKVILTSGRRSQNIFSRIFTGEIRFIRADHFAPPLTIAAAGGKKKVKLHQENKSGSAWEIYPASIFGQYEKGTATNRKTGDKSDIEFS